MSLYPKLQQRAASNNPVHLGLIGAGKFGSMYLAQVPKTPGLHPAAIADLSPVNARKNLKRVGWEVGTFSATSIDEAVSKGSHLRRGGLAGAY